MKLKTLLLGSAAAMIAFTGAQAADAVVAEPEPVDYVRVCDMYGSGFFYIPGTETCLRIRGYARVQYEYTSVDGGSSLGEAAYEGRVIFDAQSETDYGTLIGRIQLDAGGNNRATSNLGRRSVVQEVQVALGNFSMGFYNNAYSVAGHQNVVLDNNDTFNRVFQGGYTYAANGLSANVGIIVDPNNLNGVLGTARTDADAGRSIDPYARVGFALAGVSVTGSVVYDSSQEETAYGVRVGVTPIDGLNMWAWYEGETGITSYAAHDEFYGIGASYGLTDTVTAAVGYTFADDPHSGADDIERYNVALTWAIAPGLTMNADYQHTETDNGFGRPAVGDTDEFRVRFTRSF